MACKLMIAVFVLSFFCENLYGLPVLDDLSPRKLINSLFNAFTGESVSNRTEVPKKEENAKNKMDNKLLENIEWIYLDDSKLLNSGNKYDDKKYYSDLYKRQIKDHSGSMWKDNDDEDTSYSGDYSGDGPIEITTSKTITTTTAASVTDNNKNNTNLINESDILYKYNYTVKGRKTSSISAKCQHGSVYDLWNVFVTVTRNGYKSKFYKTSSTECPTDEVSLNSKKAILSTIG